MYVTACVAQGSRTCPVNTNDIAMAFHLAPSYKADMHAFLMDNIHLAAPPRAIKLHINIQNNSHAFPTAQHTVPLTYRRLAVLQSAACIARAFDTRQQPVIRAPTAQINTHTRACAQRHVNNQRCRPYCTYTHEGMTTAHARRYDNSSRTKV